MPYYRTLYVAPETFEVDFYMGTTYIVLAYTVMAHMIMASIFMA